MTFPPIGDSIAQTKLVTLYSLSFHVSCLFRYISQHGAYNITMYSDINLQILQQSAKYRQKLTCARFMYCLLKPKMQILIDQTLL